YHIYANSAERKGYSGTAIFSKIKPLSVTFDMGLEEHDQEGRITCAEYDKFFLVCVYVPNSGSELARLSYRQKWDADFLIYLKNLEKHKPVVVCGDFNVAHQAIDLSRPKENYNKAAGYMQAEIDGMSNFLKNGFVDTFRWKNPETLKYSWWSYRAGARPKNIGWRIDYFLCSESFKENISEANIYNDIFGSDHCPVGIELKEVK
ncbi:MAG: exodeoxyribonuclease III, partial [Flavobacteriia bacterium]|nr:exodeoxyribonuclease III [Flavobacteriia bacterium]